MLNLIKGTKWILVFIAALAVTAVVTVIAMQEPIPAAGTADSGNGRIHEQTYAGAIATVRDELDGYRASLVSPSISVAVGVGGKLVWADARGYANIESRIPATPDTVYAVGSVSKPLTAVLTALLWQDDQLDLDVDVRTYVPNFPAKGDPITLRQLLSHQAGIRHYGFAWKPPVFRISWPTAWAPS